MGEFRGSIWEGPGGNEPEGTYSCLIPLRKNILTMAHVARPRHKAGLSLAGKMSLNFEFSRLERPTRLWPKHSLACKCYTTRTAKQFHTSPQVADIVRVVFLFSVVDLRFQVDFWRGPPKDEIRPVPIS